jgi:hypothetical protein
MILNFSCRIVCDDEGVNPLHLCEEIQCYLNSNHHLVDNYPNETDESYINAKVISYSCETDKQLAFFAQEEY